MPRLSSFFVIRLYVICRKSLKMIEGWKLEWCEKEGVESNTVALPLTISGSSYGHPPSVEHPRSRSAQKNPSAGSGSCLFKKCGGGKSWTPFVSLHYLLILWKNMELSSILFDLFCSLWLSWRRKWLKLIMWQSMKIQTSIDSCSFVHCIPVVFAFQIWLQTLFQWYANV